MSAPESATGAQPVAVNAAPSITWEEIAQEFTKIYQQREAIVRDFTGYVLKPLSNIMPQSLKEFMHIHVHKFPAVFLMGATYDYKWLPSLVMAIKASWLFYMHAQKNQPQEPIKESATTLAALHVLKAGWNGVNVLIDPNIHNTLACVFDIYSIAQLNEIISPAPVAVAPREAALPSPSQKKE